MSIGTCNMWFMKKTRTIVNSYTSQIFEISSSVLCVRLLILKKTVASSSNNLFFLMFWVIVREIIKNLFISVYTSSVSIWRHIKTSKEVKVINCIDLLYAIVLLNFLIYFVKYQHEISPLLQGIVPHSGRIFKASKVNFPLYIL